ncbi:rhomboid family intramembrane serine protease [Adhaeribacter soli]|uniref:Rhomboid family intramembrane serine protease n=1 Tax=Adhaeribacter soli TaxID=2607655 RepID=A0A5N1IM97_9BACT|nr:rhomboid family intramembrane serine protease [Adhaeribacter soli]
MVGFSTLKVFALAAAKSRFLPGSIQEESNRLRRSFLPGLLFAGLMWLVFVPAFFLDLDLGSYGLYPRRLHGLLGVLTAPFLHGDWAHLLSNTFSLILLSAIMVFMFPLSSGRIWVCLFFSTGILAWLMARPAYHIGASGIVYSLASFIFFGGMFRRDRSAVAYSLVISFLYGSMLYGIFPTEERVSWESHLAGGIAGLIFAFVFRHTDVVPAEPELAPEPEEPEAITQPPHINASFTGQPQIVVRYTFVPGKPEEKPESGLEKADDAFRYFGN